jgi:hypothetical protein
MYLMYYLKHNHSCFIRYKDTRLWSLDCFKNYQSGKFIGKVIFKKICCVDKISWENQS